MSTSQTSTRPATVVMVATYVVGGAGIAVGFATMSSGTPSLRWATLLAVGAVGLLSFVRHSLLHRSDAARMGWDLGHRNNFQIEVGLANLAWGLTALWAAAAALGLAVDGALFLVEGVYLGSVAIMQAVAPGDQGRSTPAIVGTGVFAAALLALAVWGLSAA